MGKHIVTLPGLKGGKKDMVAIFDGLPDFTDAAQAVRNRGDYERAQSWNGGLSYDEAARLNRNGDLSRVAASDKFLADFEDLLGFKTRKFATVDAVAGGVPNVGAFLAGNPVNMRRRQRIASEQAPLNIVVDIVSSGGIDAKHLERRGAALLALTRILSAIRPIQFWIVAVGMPGGQNTYSAVGSAFRLDTAPLDLGRAAHALCYPGVARQHAYCMMGEMGNGKNGWISWPYGDHEYSRSNGVKFWQRFLGLDEMLYIAAPFVDDAAIKEPAKWLKEMVAKYGLTAIEH